MFVLCSRCTRLLRAQRSAPAQAEARWFCSTSRNLAQEATALPAQLSGTALAERARAHRSVTHGRTRRASSVRAMGGVVEGVPTVSVYEARELMGAGATYLDVRTVEEYHLGHAPGAVNIPVFNAEGGGMKPNPDFVSKVEQELPEKDQQLVLGCKVGKRSAMALQMLADQGYTNMSNIGGGFDVWSEEGLPIER